MDKTIAWLLNGDVSIQYMVHRDLLHSSEEQLSALQHRIEREGIGAKYLACQNENGHWGIYYYQPKWTCTHYTLLEMKNIGMPKDCPQCVIAGRRIFDECIDDEGSVNFAKTKLPSDVAICGMVLNYACYFGAAEEALKSQIDFLLKVRQPDGGFSWNFRVDPNNSDPHSTICVLEGFLEFRLAGYTYRLDEIERAEKSAINYLLDRNLFCPLDKSMAFDKRYLKLSYPFRYRYDCLRALEYFARSCIPFEDRMSTAFEWLISKQRPDGNWYLENKHPGNTHFELERAGEPSRFITMKALFIKEWHKKSTKV